MSYVPRLQQWLAPERFDRTLAKVGLVTAVFLLGLRLLTEQVLLLVIPISIGTACLLYLEGRTDGETHFEYPRLPSGVIGYLPSAVFVGLTGLVLLTFVSGGRTIPVYLLTATVGSAILAQTLLVGEDDLTAGVVLAQILAAAVVVRLTALFVTPGYIGVDIWTHGPVFIDGIVEAGSLSPLAESKYSMAPLYHVIGAAGALVFGSVRTGLYLSVGLLVPLSAVFIYGAGKLLVPARWALVATALYVFADQAIRWGLHVIPTSLGLVFFLGALYALTKLFFTDDLWVIGLLVACSLAVVFTHQVSAAIVLVLLAVAAGSVLFSHAVESGGEGQSARSITGIVGTFLLTLVVTLASWAVTPWYADKPFLWQILDTFAAAVTTNAGFLNLAGSGAGGGAAASSGLVAELVPFVQWFGFGLLLLTVVVGGLAMLRMENPSGATLTYLVSGAAMFVIVFGFSLFGVRTIMPGRWIAFMYALFAIVGAAGLYYLSHHASRRVLVVVFLLVTVGYPSTMVVAEKATLDSPAFEDEFARFSYTESELAALHTIETIYPPGAERPIASDHPYKSIYGRAGGYTGQVATFENGRLASSSPVVARTYQGEGPAIFHEGGTAERQIASQSVSAEQVCPPERNRVYVNDMVKLCTTPASGGGE